MSERDFIDFLKAFKGEVGSSPKTHNFWLGVFLTIGIFWFMSNFVFGISGVQFENSQDVYTQTEDGEFNLRCQKLDERFLSSIRCEKPPGYNEEWDMQYPDFALELTQSPGSDSHVNLVFENSKTSSRIQKTQLREGDKVSLNDIELKVTNTREGALSIQPIVYSTPQVVLGTGSIILLVLALFSASMFYVIRAFNQFIEDQE